MTDMHPYYSLPALLAVRFVFCFFRPGLFRSLFLRNELFRSHLFRLFFDHFFFSSAFFRRLFLIRRIFSGNRLRGIRFFLSALYFFRIFFIGNGSFRPIVRRLTIFRLRLLLRFF